MKKINLRDGVLYVSCCDTCPCCMMVRDGGLLCRITKTIIDEPNKILDGCRLEEGYKLRKTPPTCVESGFKSPPGTYYNY